MFRRLIALLFLTTPLFAVTYTTNAGIAKPEDGDTGWGTTLRGDFDIIDSSFAILPVDLGSEVTGTLPSENTVSTTVYTGKQNVFTDTNNFQNVFVSSLSVSGTLNLNSLTANRCVQTGTDGVLTVTGAACSGGGGGSSSLAVNQNGTQITSPTVAINALSPPFTLTAVAAGATAQWALDGSSVTLFGNNVIKLQNSLQPGATFYVSSGTASQFTSNKIFVSTLAVSGDTTMDNARITGSGGLKIDNLTASQCVQTGAGGLLTVTGGACGGAPGGSSGQMQYNNGGNFAGTALQTIGTSSITFTTVSSATYTGFSTMTMTGMVFDGSTSTMTFSSGTITNLYSSTGTFKYLGISTATVINGTLNNTSAFTVLTSGVGGSSAIGVDSRITGATTSNNYAGQFLANGTSTGSNNALYLDSNGATSNHAIYLNRGDVVLGGDTGTSGQVFTSGGSNVTPAWSSNLTGVTVAGSSFRLMSSSGSFYGNTPLQIGNATEFPPTSTTSMRWFSYLDSTLGKLSYVKGSQVTGLPSGFRLTLGDSDYPIVHFNHTDRASGSGTVATTRAIIAPSTAAFQMRDGDNGAYVALRSSVTLVYNQNYVMPDSTGPVNQSLTIQGINSDNSIALTWQYATFGSSTTAGLAQTTPSSTNQTWYCSDCSNALTCISTGTAKGAFSSMQAANRTTICN